MNRTVIGVLAFVIGVLVSFFWLQETKVRPLDVKLKAVEAQTHQVPPTPAPCAQWETLADGTKVLKMWEKLGPDWPQIALFYLSNDLYQKLKNSPSDFVNDRKIFPVPVQPKASMTAGPATKQYSGAWVVMCGHHADSTTNCASFAAENVSVSKPEKKQ